MLNFELVYVLFYGDNKNDIEIKYLWNLSDFCRWLALNCELVEVSIEIPLANKDFDETNQLALKLHSSATVLAQILLWVF